MTEYMASSLLVGRRPRISLIRAYSSAFSPSSAHGCSRSGSFSARPTVSSTGKGYRSVVEEGALAPVTRPGERYADLLRGLVAVASATSSTNGGTNYKSVLLPNRWDSCDW